MSECFRVLVLTLASGENEYERCCESVKRQNTSAMLTQEVIEGLPAKSAHETLYRRIMRESGSFDVFIKLDADMVFARDDAVEIILKHFRENPALDHLEFAVHDFFTGGRIIGAHAFSCNARWNRDDEDLFVDPRPSIPGEYKRLGQPAEELVLHSPNPTPLQAFQFGVHRGLKVWQHGRRDRDVGHSYYQFRALRSVWRNWKCVGDERLALALLGCEVVRRNGIDAYNPDKNQKRVFDAFEEWARCGHLKDAICTVVYGSIWGWVIWASTIGFKRVLARCCGAMLRRIPIGNQSIDGKQA